jgi:hypothetical protein
MYPVEQIRKYFRSRGISGLRVVKYGKIMLDTRPKRTDNQALAIPFAHSLTAGRTTAVLSVNQVGAVVMWMLRKTWRADLWFRARLEELESRVVPGFVAPLAFDAGHWPISVATGDFVGNGVLDLATANETSSNVSVLLGNGDGTFQSAKNFLAGSYPTAIAAGDLRANGILDLAVANGFSDNISILLGNGDGTFQQPHNYACSGTAPVSLALADLRRDGILDIVVANAGTDSVSVFLGNGDGTFQGAKDLATGKQPRSVTVADFNGDGIPDLAVPNAGSNNVSVLLGNGDGTFKSAQNVPVATQPFSVAAGDFTGNGITDLVVANVGDFYSGAGSELDVLFGNGDGTFQVPHSFAIGSGALIVSTADFNGDGTLDLAVTSAVTLDVNVYLGNGDGTFQDPGKSFPGGAQSITVGDFNGDGTLDLAIPSPGPDNVNILLGNGDGTFQTAPRYAAGSKPDAIVSGDFNGDGIVDLAVANYASSNVSILLGNGDGTFQSPRNFSTPLQPNSLAVGDLTGNGILDLVVTSYSPSDPMGKVSVLFGIGDGTFQPPYSFVAGVAPDAVAVGDFTGDGILDLAVANTGVGGQTSTVSIFLGNGDGTFQQPKNFDAGLWPDALALGDFNGDGKLDLVVARHDSADVLVCLGNGDGTFHASGAYHTGTYPWAISIADFTGNGILDLAVANLLDGNVSVLLGKGDGSFGAAKNYYAGDPYGVAVGDFYGDGRIDLAVASGGARILRGNGDGTFQATAITFVAGIPSGIAVGDFKGNGCLDLALANYYSNDVSILMNDSTGIVPVHSSTRSALARVNPLDLRLGDGANQLVALRTQLTNRANETSRANSDRQRAQTIGAVLGDDTIPGVAAPAYRGARPWLVRLGRPPNALQTDAEDIMASVNFHKLDCRISVRR